MAYCKKRCHVTIELLEELVGEIKEHFYKSPAPVKYKKLCKKINPVFHIINRKKWFFYGQAQAIGKYAKSYLKRQLKLSCKTHPCVTLDGCEYFLVIEINLGLRSFTRRGLRYLVAHEYAHLLQMVHDEEVYNQASYATESDHDWKWQTLCKCLGGVPSEFIEEKYIWC